MKNAKKSDKPLTKKQSCRIIDRKKQEVAAMEKRRSAIILLACFALIISFFSLFTIAEAEHDCVVDECHICHAIEVAERTLSGLVSSESSVAATVVAQIGTLLGLAMLAVIVPASTLVTQKVKLSD